MKSINPDSENLSNIFAKIPSNTPIVMINLLKFRKVADDPQGAESRSGKEAYTTYSKTAAKMVKKVGGKPIWMGQVHGSLIAPSEESWDEALLIRYPSIEAFKQMLFDPEYQKCTVHRTAALEDSRLIASVET